jgi:hypothetical protein
MSVNGGVGGAEIVPLVAGDPQRAPVSRNSTDIVNALQHYQNVMLFFVDEI